MHSCACNVFYSRSKPEGPQYYVSRFWSSVFGGAEEKVIPLILNYRPLLNISVKSFGFLCTCVPPVAFSLKKKKNVCVCKQPCTDLIVQHCMFSVFMQRNPCRLYPWCFDRCCSWTDCRSAAHNLQEAHRGHAWSQDVILHTQTLSIKYRGLEFAFLERLCAPDIIQSSGSITSRQWSVVSERTSQGHITEKLREFVK